MLTQTPCSDHIKTKGLIYFARMLDKIRLKARGELPPDYFTGADEDPTMFDARCTRFLAVNYDELVARALKGGSNEEILEWCFKAGRRPSEDEIAIWNAFLSKRGWRDEASADLQAAKKRSGFANRNDIQTWIDLHDAEEGRTPQPVFST
jgi:gluconokinase